MLIEGWGEDIKIIIVWCDSTWRKCYGIPLHRIPNSAWGRREDSHGIRPLGRLKATRRILLDVPRHSKGICHVQRKSGEAWGVLVSYLILKSRKRGKKYKWTSNLGPPSYQNNAMIIDFLLESHLKIVSKTIAFDSQIMKAWSGRSLETRGWVRGLHWSGWEAIKALIWAVGLGEGSLDVTANSSSDRTDEAC